MDGLLKAYAESRQIVKLYGPTNFEPVIRHVSMMAKECRKRAYHVLIILTGKRAIGAGQSETESQSNLVWHATFACQ